jgi:hypothetical protein
VVLGFGISFQDGTTGGMTWSMADERPSIVAAPNEKPSPRAAVINNMGQAVGNELLTRFVIPFELAGLLLTAALVGAIALAHGEELEPGARRPADQAEEPASTDGPVSSEPATSVAAGAGH